MVDINTFNIKLVEYYKEHDNEYVKKITTQYVEKTYSEHNLGLLLTAIMKSHPYKYGYPDVSAIEKAHNLFMKDGGNNLKSNNGSGEWHTAIKPLTEEERKQAEPMRKDWNELINKLADKKADHRSCKKCMHISPDKNNYNCRGCIKFSKFEAKSSQQEK